VTREAYAALLRPRVSPRERRTLLRLRAFLLVWCIGVAAVLAPLALLALLLVPGHLRRYARRIDSGRLLLHG
jgi:hypothetical protein